MSSNYDSITRPIMIPISISAAGDNVVITGLPNQYIYVRQLLLTSPGGAQTITLKDGTTTLSNFELNANDGLVLENTAPDFPFLLDCKAGDNFIINLSAATSVIGHVSYGYRQ